MRNYGRLRSEYPSLRLSLGFNFFVKTRPAPKRTAHEELKVHGFTGRRNCFSKPWKKFFQDSGNKNAPQVRGVCKQPF
jgi:hypothetical protein